MRFKNIYNETKDNVESSMLSLWTPGRHRMRAALKDLLAREPIMAEPIFQSMFPWETTNDPNWKQYLNQEVITRLHIGPEAGGDYPPYQLQTDSWRELRNGNSVVVTSGTGSGKTECFMYPVISDLYEQLQAGEDRAVEAIFLYPLNALMQDQKERLGVACQQTGLRFAVYNGSLPETTSSPNAFAANNQYEDAEVRSRKDIRQINERPHIPSLPHILLTNPSMLEYMLVRKEDHPIFERSKRKLRWVIIDETHTYTGSAAVELAYLIKRVLSAFDVSREDVRFVCTSATIGDPSQPQQLLDFIESIIGEYPADSNKQLVRIGGTRVVPSLTEEEVQEQLDCRGITNTSANRVLSLRNDINRIPMSLGDIWQNLTLTPLNDMNAALDLVDQLCDIQLDYGPRDKRFVLMLRGHFFMRSISGLYACVNPQCGNTTPHRDTGFKFLTTNKGDGCCPHCGAPLLEVMQCGACKEFLLSCEENNDFVIRRCDSEIYDDSVDDYNNNDDAGDDDEITDGGQQFENWTKKYFAFYGNGRNYAKPHPNYRAFSLGFNWDGNNLVSDNTGDERPWVELQNQNRLYCPTCSGGSGSNGEKFKHFRLPTNWLNNTIAPALLMEGADAVNIWGKYIAFTDSRQGTAINAKSFNIESERAYARAHLVESLSNPNVKYLTISETAESIFNEQMFEHIHNDILNNMPEYRRNAFVRDEIAYKTSLIRSIIGRRPVASNSCENLGLISLRYPVVDDSNAPDCWLDAGFNDVEWKCFLKIAIDYVIRQGNHLQYPTYGERSYLRDNDKNSLISENDWPTVRRERNNNNVCLRQNRLVLLLCAGLGISNTEQLQAQADMVDNLLREVWSFVSRNILTYVDDNHEYANHSDNINKYYLDFSLDSNICRIERSVELWICPVSNYLLDTIFRGYSPHIKGCLDANNINRYRCLERPDVSMPVLENQANYNEWSLTNAEVIRMREAGVWNDRHKYAYQPKPEGFLTIEHSGQQDRNLLACYTERFKARHHSLNLLQCSTTMEMGVNIGDIDVVLMTNIPPTAANYLQRAGRAGRNGQSRSVAYSLCPNTSIGNMAFDDPMSFITSSSTVNPPIKSNIIIQRHINSFFMYEFVSAELVSTQNVEEWFDDGGISFKFDDFLDGIARDPVITARYSRVFGNAIEYTSGLRYAKVRLDEIRNEYQIEHRTLIEEFEAAEEQDDERKMNAISIQLASLDEQPFKAYLSSKQYLPNANFPTGIVEFNHITKNEYDRIVQLKARIEQLEIEIENEGRPDRKKSKKSEKRGKQSDIQKILERTITTRDINIALSEYAPDQEVVINERNFKSEGIEWKNSYRTGNPLKFLYHCRQCGRYEYSNDGNLERCPSCQSPLNNLLSPRNRQRFTLAIEPVRFRTDIHRDNNIKENNLKRYYKRDTILTHIDWNNPIQDSMCELVGNGNGQGEIVFINKGVGQGFKLCLDCGRMVLEDNNFNNWTHKPLTDRSEVDERDNCLANNVRHSVVLSGTFPTSYVSIRFKNFTNPRREFEDDTELLYSMGVVLRTALAHIIGINVDEIDFGIREEAGYRSLFIYDTMKGGCGYSTQMLNDDVRNRVFDEARSIVRSYECDCEKNTRGACVKCLVDRNSQRYERYLSKFKVLNWFTRQNLLLATPPIPDAFVVPMTLKHQVTKLTCDANVTRLTFCVDASEMNVRDWISFEGVMGSLLLECHKHNKQVAIKVYNVPSVERGGSLADLIPFVDFPQRIQYTIESVESLEFQEGLYSALFVDGIATLHFFVNQADVLPFSELWGDGCVSLFCNRTIPDFTPSVFPTTDDIIRLCTPTKCIRTGSVRGMTTTIGNFYNDVIRGNVLSGDDENDIITILRGKRVNITFSDSYVNSALASLMLTYLIKSIKELTNFEIGRVDFQFQARNRRCDNARWDEYTPIHLSFPNADMADDYTSDQIEGVFGVVPNFLNGIPDHYRWLCFQPEGESCYVEIRPDHGIAGGWKSNKKYIDADRLDGNTSIKTNADTSEVYYVLIDKGDGE